MDKRCFDIYFSKHKPYTVSPIDIDDTVYKKYVKIIPMFDGLSIYYKIYFIFILRRRRLYTTGHDNEIYYTITFYMYTFL